jgi:predicted DNA-binding transcriptional regulator AlpA
MRPKRIIRLKEAFERTGYTRASWYRARQIDPEFPRHIKLGPSQVGVLEEDVERLIDRLISQE